MRCPEPFALYSRPSKDGTRRGWYHSTYNEFGERTPGRSTSLTRKTLAHRYCTELYRQGQLTPAGDPHFAITLVPGGSGRAAPTSGGA
jgi:hypothetical protein